MCGKKEKCQSPEVKAHCKDRRTSPESCEKKHNDCCCSQQEEA